MKLALFGTTGATGKQLIEQALTAGNQVVAFARNPSKIGADRERLTIVQGELSDTAAIERLVSGVDAVISVLGPRPGEDRNSRPLTQGIQNILAAMTKTAVRRLIISSTPSASDPNDLPDFKFKVFGQKTGGDKSLPRRPGRIPARAGPGYDLVAAGARDQQLMLAG